MLKPCPHCKVIPIPEPSSSSNGYWIKHLDWCLLKALVRINGVDVERWNHRPSAWIPVSERLPEENQIVLVCNKRGRIQLIHWWNGDEKDIAEYWQPIPEPPEEG